MKTLYPLLCSLLLLTACATSSTHTAKVEEPKKHYIGFLTLIGNFNSDFSRLDSLTYETHIRGKFNNLEQSRYRNHLEKALKETLMSRAQTRIVSSSDIFKLNDDISYSEFLERVRKTGVETILLVNLHSFWHSISYSTDDNLFNKPEPNALFNTYLLDVQNLEPVWYAKSVVNGVYANYETLNNTFARQLLRKLRKDEYILVPEHARYWSSYTYQQE
jgi:hypothetical protein